ncbi:MAG: valine--tRNA ligase, partial [Chloroflexi bacterium CG23_combo_of_CG06-09_8_20_14_all_45_10]
AKQTQGPQRVEDRWICSRLNRLISNVTQLMGDFQFGEAAQQIYDFIWSKFCDWYIEIAKIRLRTQLPPSPLPFLVNTLEKSLRLLHPFMPFISEGLWQSLKQQLVLSEAKNLQMPASIMIAPYPTPNEKAIDSEAERAMDAVIEIIRSIRNARSQYKVAPSKWIKAGIFTDDLLPYITSQAKAIETLARARPLAILKRQERKAGKEKALILVLKEAEVLLPWTGMIDELAEKKRLIKEKELTQARIAQLNTRLRDITFLTKAPPHIVEKEKQKLYLLRDKLERLKSELSQFD